MILVDHQLRRWAEDGGLTPFNPDNINPASVDLCWSGKRRLATPRGWSEIITSGHFASGHLYLIDTLEYIKMPRNCVGFMALKSSMARRGLEMLHSGFVDPGFEGTLTMTIEVKAPWPIALEKAQPIVQLILAQLATMPENVYHGRYQCQKEPTEAKYE